MVFKVKCTLRYILLTDDRWKCVFAFLRFSKAKKKQKINFMEVICRIIEQLPLQEREYVDKNGKALKLVQRPPALGSAAFTKRQRLKELVLRPRQLVQLPPQRPKTASCWAISTTHKYSRIPRWQIRPFPAPSDAFRGAGLVLPSPLPFAAWRALFWLVNSSFMMS